jgi:hypothetical protein
MRIIAWHEVPGTEPQKSLRAGLARRFMPRLNGAKIRNALGGFNARSRRGLVPEGRSDRSLARSAWNSHTPKEPSRRARSDRARTRLLPADSDGSGLRAAERLQMT